MSYLKESFDMGLKGMLGGCMVLAGFAVYAFVVWMCTFICWLCLIECGIAPMEISYPAILLGTMIGSMGGIIAFVLGYYMGKAQDDISLMTGAK